MIFLYDTFFMFGIGTGFKGFLGGFILDGTGLVGRSVAIVFT
jgi:hypothetical protein